MKKNILLSFLVIFFAGSAHLQSLEKSDLNTATMEELIQIKGIGKKKAEKIIMLRDKKKLSRITELLQIKGIGQKTILKLSERFYVARPERPKHDKPRLRRKKEHDAVSLR